MRSFAHQHGSKGNKVIQSFRIDITPDENGHVFLLLDTVQEGKHVFTAMGVGRVQNNAPLLTATGQATLFALMAHADGKTQGRVHFAEIATVAAAPMRVRKALERADQEDIVFFVCRNPDVYDAAWAALNVSLDPPTGVQ